MVLGLEVGSKIQSQSESKIVSETWKGPSIDFWTILPDFGIPLGGKKPPGMGLQLLKNLQKYFFPSIFLIF